MIGGGMLSICCAKEDESLEYFLMFATLITSINGHHRFSLRAGDLETEPDYQQKNLRKPIIEIDYTDIQ